MRRGEILGLRWTDVSLKERVIHIRQSVTKVSGRDLIFLKPKTNSSIRPINIDEDVVAALKRRKSEQNQNKLLFGSKYDNQHNLIFCKENGKPFLPQYATRQFNEIAKKVDLSHFRLHDLRHTHATLMLKAGVHPKIVQERLGHALITVTLDTYSHVIPSMQKEAVQKLKNTLQK